MDVRAWQTVLADADAADVMEAIRRHYAEHTERIMPAHIRRTVRDMVHDRSNVSLAEARQWAAEARKMLRPGKTR